MLYPLKFRPHLKERLWGGDLLARLRGGRRDEGKRIGESWELSGLPGDVSVVAGGPLKGNSLADLAEVYMGDLVGERVFARYGELFPLLIKLIDAREVLSVQVHPGDALAARMHNSYGKTELWYVVSAEPGAVIYLGFRRRVTPGEYASAVEAGTLPSLLRRIGVKAGDAFFIPAGTVHALGAGVMVAEVQQASDITYRIDDWGRTDSHGKPRALHRDLAAGAVDFGAPADLALTARPQPNRPVLLKKCPYFTINLLEIADSGERDYAPLDSFVALVCLDGSVSVDDGQAAYALSAGETMLIPAVLDEVTLTGRGKLLEVYIE